MQEYLRVHPFNKTVWELWGIAEPTYFHYHPTHITIMALPQTTLGEMKEMVSQGKVYPLGLTFGDLEQPVERQVTVSSVRSRWKEALMEEKLRLSTQLKLHLTRSMKEGKAKHNIVEREG